MSERLAMQILTIAHHLLTHNRFNRYPQYAKDEMRQEAYLKCHRNLKNYNPDKVTLFSYFTRCCWTAFVTYLAKYYKDMNESRQLLMDALSDLEANPDIHSSTYMEELKRRLKDLEYDVSEDDDE